MKKYFVNYDLGMVTKADKKPKPINRNLRYNNKFAEWTEVAEEEYNRMYNQLWDDYMK